VNAGGSAVSADPTWSADTNTSPSPYSNVEAAQSTRYQTSKAIDVGDPSIPPGTPASLFQSERYDRPAGEEMLWSFPVTPGSYVVRLYFAELYFTTPGARVFNVALEGEPVLQNYDIVADVGALKGVVKSFAVVSDASLDIAFTRLVENPKINAIEILQPLPSAGELVASPGFVAFDSVLVGHATSRTVQITNAGGAQDPNIDVYGAFITGTDAGDFSHDFPPGTTITLAPGQSASITVGFGPSSVGTKSASLEISHMGVNHPLVIPLSGGGISVAPGTWQARAPSGLARQGVAYVHLNGRFYLAGGGTAHEVYDPASDTWSALTPLPVSVDRIQGVTLGGRIYYIGGLLGWPEPASSAVYIYDPVTDTMTTGAPMPRPRGAGGIAVHNGLIYYAGGLASGSTVPWFDAYDPTANTWTALPDMPVARDHFHAAVVAGRFYVTGGRATSTNTLVSSTMAYDFGSGLWQSSGLAPMPTPRAGFGAGVLGSEIVLIGGEGGGQSHTAVEAYDTATNTWRVLAPMPTARHGIQAATCNGGLYVAAGGTTTGTASPTNVHEVFFLGSATTCAAPAPPPSGVLYRVNAGGPAISATPNWAADTSTSPSPYSNVSAASSATYTTATQINVSDPSVPAGTPGTLFQSERYDRPAGTDMVWSFPVTPGQYDVRLYFAEIFFLSPGQRVFDVAIEGQTVLSNYDIHAEVGPYKGVVKTFTVMADDSLDIAFARVLDNPKVSAIEILDATPRPNELGVAPASLAFGSVTLGEGNTLPLHVTNLGNPGDPSIVITGTTIAGTDAGQFSDNFPDGAGITLAPQQSTTISVTFTPTSTGAKSGSLQVAHSGVNTVAVPLSGTGVDPSTSLGIWQHLAPASIARHETTYVHYNGKFYLAGDRGRLEHEVYDSVTNTWGLAAPLPAEFHHAQGVELNGLIYYLGGLVGPYPDHVTAAVNIYNPATNTWSSGTPMPAGRARGGGGTALYNGWFYVAGGLQDDASGTGHLGVSTSLFDVYDPVAGTWTALPDMPRARDHFHAAIVGTKFYAIGGRKGGDAGFFNAVIAPVDVFDFTTGTWSTLPASANIPTPRAGVGVAAMGSKIFVIGGEGNGNAYDKVEAFDTVTQTWQTMTPMPTARHGFQAAVCNGGIYTATGGLTQGGGSLTKIHQVFFPGGEATGCGTTAPPPPPPVGFGKTTLTGTTSLNNPTSLQFGPDGRLYVSQQNGLIRVYTVARNGANSYGVTGTEIINVINSVPNHNDDGILNPNVTTRLITGILVVGTAANP
jgi:hypothetical protein